MDGRPRVCGSNGVGRGCVGRSMPAVGAGADGHRNRRGDSTGPETIGLPRPGHRSAVMEGNGRRRVRHAVGRARVEIADRNHDSHPLYAASANR